MKRFSGELLAMDGHSPRVAFDEAPTEVCSLDDVTLVFPAVQCSPDDVTLTYPANEATRIDAPEGVAVPLNDETLVTPPEQAGARRWHLAVLAPSVSGRALPIGGAAVVTFVASALLTHFAAAAHRVPPLPPRPAGSVSVAKLRVPAESVPALTAAQAAAVLLSGNAADASAAYRILALRVPKDPVFGVVARTLARERGERARSAP